MNPRSNSTTSISRQLGLTFTLVAVLLAAVCLVVVAHLHDMREDARRLLEETQEHAVTSRIAVQIDTLHGLVESWPGDPEPGRLRSRVRELDDAIESGLNDLRGPAGKDPSREEHQAAEDVQVASVRRSLSDAVALLLADPTPDDLTRAGRMLRHASEFANELHEETFEESRQANRDLDGRGRQARRIMIVTVLVALLVLACALVFVMRSIVRPLRELTRGAERFGQGDLSHRIPPRRKDEVGELAGAFNAMANRIEEAHGGLEARVEARTREFLRAARLADLGVLAAGVAHEVNNPLASIASCAEGLERRLRAGRVDEAEQLDYLRTISSEAYRAREITGQLLSLAAQERDGEAPVDVALVLSQVRAAARHLLEKRGIRLEVDAEDGLFYPGSAPELMQILINLLLNARDADPRDGLIRLVARRAGEDVVFEVSDRGDGIAREDIERIFDPFFTTKRPGKGTGLGLSVVAALVEARAGRLAVESEPGEGALFRVSFPTARADRATASEGTRA